jgi:hypothetical protein
MDSRKQAAADALRRVHKTTELPGASRQLTTPVDPNAYSQLRSGASAGVYVDPKQAAANACRLI